MAKRFPLMPLLRMRETAEQKAAQELARARERAARERAREVRATQSLGDHEFDQLLTETQWRSALASRASLQGLLAESKAARELAEHEADVTHAHWAVAKQQVAGWRSCGTGMKNGKRSRKRKQSRTFLTSWVHKHTCGGT